MRPLAVTLSVPVLLLALLALPAPGAAGLVAAGPGVTAAPRADTGVDPRVERSRPDPRWVFYTRHRHRYTSPWWRGARRMMIGYGCTRAPYYSPDPRCRHGRGFHHGIDVALPCGARIFAGRGGRVVRADRYGPAYGVNPLVIRNRRHGVDLLVAHARRTYVDVGDRVRRGQLLARSSDSGAPDGCHLHLEARAIGGGLDRARNPRPFLDRVRRPRRGPAS